MVFFVVAFVLSVYGSYMNDVWVEIFYLASFIALFFSYNHRRNKTPILFYLVYFISIVTDGLLIYDYRALESLILFMYTGVFLGMILFSIIEFKPFRPEPIDWLSLLIIYSFILWLIYYMFQISQHLGLPWRIDYSVYTIVLAIFSIISYTHYTGKSYKASLWLALSSAFAIMAGVIYFIYEYSISTYFVKLFYTIFHFLWFFAILNYIKERRTTNKLRFFGV
ncbi:hypothetical protein [Gangjinia marincola]|uniref:hypothetical protein n=1 Tax=Gangjinia marincola TaxID=578463 RepID=UPI0031D00798